MPMETVVLKISSFALVILIGIIISKRDDFTEEITEFIAKIVFKLTLPCSIINAFGSTHFTLDLLVLIPLSLLITVIQFFLSYYFYRNEKQEDLVLQLTNVSGYNVGCFTLPFAQEFFSPTAVLACCLFDAGNALMTTGGTLALVKSLIFKNKKENRFYVFLHTLFSSIAFDVYILLITINGIGFELPKEITLLTSPIAQANSFLAMLMIGLMFKSRFKDNGRKQLYRLLLWRYSFAVILSLLVFPHLPFSRDIQYVLCILVWSPIPSISPMYTFWCKGDEGLASMVNTISVLIGIIAITVFMIIQGL